MKCSIVTAATLLLLLGAAPSARANWFTDCMNPYPGYGHPSFYFPPAVAAFYAGYGYPSIIPGTDYYTPTAAAGASYPTRIVTRYHAVFVPCSGPDCPPQGSYFYVPYQTVETVPPDSSNR